MDTQTEQPNAPDSRTSLDDALPSDHASPANAVAEGEAVAETPAVVPSVNTASTTQEAKDRGEPLIIRAY